MLMVDEQGGPANPTKAASSGRVFQTTGYRKAKKGAEFVPRAWVDR
jgi:hypothetical protein